MFIERVSGRLRGRGGQVEAVEEVDQDRTTGRACQPGDEMEQELTDAWNLFTRVGAAQHRPQLILLCRGRR